MEDKAELKKRAVEVSDALLKRMPPMGSRTRVLATDSTLF